MSDFYQKIENLVSDKRKISVIDNSEIILTLVESGSKSKTVDNTGSDEYIFNENIDAVKNYGIQIGLWKEVEKGLELVDEDKWGELYDKMIDLVNINTGSGAQFKPIQEAKKKLNRKRPTNLKVVDYFKFIPSTKNWHYAKEYLHVKSDTYYYRLGFGYDTNPKKLDNKGNPIPVEFDIRRESSTGDSKYNTTVLNRTLQFFIGMSHDDIVNIQHDPERDNELFKLGKNLSFLQPIVDEYRSINYVNRPAKYKYELKPDTIKNFGSILSGLEESLQKTEETDGNKNFEFTTFKREKDKIAHRTTDSYTAILDNKTYYIKLVYDTDLVDEYGLPRIVNILIERDREPEEHRPLFGSIHKVILNASTVWPESDSSLNHEKEIEYLNVDRSFKNFRLSYLQPLLTEILNTHYKKRPAVFGLNVKKKTAEHFGDIIAGLEESTGHKLEKYAPEKEIPSSDGIIKFEREKLGDGSITFDEYEINNKYSLSIYYDLKYKSKSGAPLATWIELILKDRPLTPLYSSQLNFEAITSDPEKEIPEKDYLAAAINNLRTKSKEERDSITEELTPVFDLIQNTPYNQRERKFNLNIGPETEEHFGDILDKLKESARNPLDDIKSFHRKINPKNKTEFWQSGSFEEVVDTYIIGDEYEIIITYNNEVKSDFKDGPLPIWVEIYKSGGLLFEGDVNTKFFISGRKSEISELEALESPIKIWEKNRFKEIDREILLPVIKLIDTTPFKDRPVIFSHKLKKKTAEHFGEILTGLSESVERLTDPLKEITSFERKDVFSFPNNEIKDVYIIDDRFKITLQYDQNIKIEPENKPALIRIDAYYKWPGEREFDNNLYSGSIRVFAGMTELENLLHHLGNWSFGTLLMSQTDFKTRKEIVGYFKQIFKAIADVPFRDRPHVLGEMKLKPKTVETFGEILTKLGESVQRTTNPLDEISSFKRKKLSFSYPVDEIIDVYIIKNKFEITLTYDPTIKSKFGGPLLAIVEVYSKDRGEKFLFRLYSNYVNRSKSGEKSELEAFIKGLKDWTPNKEDLKIVGASSKEQFINYFKQLFTAITKVPFNKRPNMLGEMKLKPKTAENFSDIINSLQESIKQNQEPKDRIKSFTRKGDNGTFFGTMIKKFIDTYVIDDYIIELIYDRTAKTLAGKPLLTSISIYRGEEKKENLIYGRYINMHRMFRDPLKSTSKSDALYREKKTTSELDALHNGLRAVGSRKHAKNPDLWENFKPVVKLIVYTPFEARPRIFGMKIKPDTEKHFGDIIGKLQESTKEKDYEIQNLKRDRSSEKSMGVVRDTFFVIHDGKKYDVQLSYNSKPTYDSKNKTWSHTPRVIYFNLWRIVVENGRERNEARYDRVRSSSIDYVERGLNLDEMFELNLPENFKFIERAVSEVMSVPYKKRPYVFGDINLKPKTVEHFTDILSELEESVPEPKKDYEITGYKRNIALEQYNMVQDFIELNHQGKVYKIQLVYYVSDNNKVHRLISYTLTHDTDRYKNVPLDGEVKRDYKSKDFEKDPMELKSKEYPFATDAIREVLAVPYKQRPHVFGEMKLKPDTAETFGDIISRLEESLQPDPDKALDTVKKFTRYTGTKGYGRNDIKDVYETNRGIELWLAYHSKIKSITGDPLLSWIEVVNRSYGKGQGLLYSNSVNDTDEWPEGVLLRDLSDPGSEHWEYDITKDRAKKIYRYLAPLLSLIARTPYKDRPRKFGIRLKPETEEHFGDILTGLMDK